VSSPALEGALEGVSQEAADDRAPASGTRRRIYFLQLAKPRLNLLVVLTTLGGYYMGARAGLLAWQLVFALLGTALVAAGAAALNQYMERDLDSLMQRTRNRPLPAGGLTPSAGLAFGASLAVAGILVLAALVNLLTAALALVTCVAYLAFYTPLKRVTPLNTLVGAIPGAIPPVMGWAAAQASLGPEAGALFAILFFWQLPHFLAIAWLYREDYARAGCRMLPLEEGGAKRTGFAAVLYSTALVPAALSPVLLGMAGNVYLVGAGVLSLGFLAASVHMARQASEAAARLLFRISLLVLPLLFLLMALDKIPRP
jgi:protoheme IX farnesyltransferase